MIFKFLKRIPLFEKKSLLIIKYLYLGGKKWYI